MKPIAIAGILLAIQVARPDQRPTLRSGVELITVDVQVARDNGEPAAGLTPAEFEVWIDGRKRTIATLDFIQSGRVEADRATGAAGAQPPGARPSETNGRTIIIGVDQASFQVASEPAAREGVAKLIALAAPEDRLGLVAYPQPGISVAPTLDRNTVVSALKKIRGQFQPPRPIRDISLAEAVDYSARDGMARAELFRRLCRSMDASCRQEIDQDVSGMVVAFESQAHRSISGLHSLMDAVREYPGRKIVVVISAGIPTTDRLGGRPDLRLEADSLGIRAAQANAVIYTLHMDVNFLLAFSAANAARGLQTVYRNSSILATGLERFTAFSGGTFITVPTGPDSAIRRVLRETSAYYLLGVETAPADRDGKRHMIRVRVKHRGVTVRSRTVVFIPKVQ
ncbi:MAG: VWA domain-containing protein [Vicinamibacterales bacterium]